MTAQHDPVDNVRAEQKRAWLASLLLRRQQTWFGRFAARLSQLTALGRGQRRRLERKAVVSLAGAALVLSLGAGLLAQPTAVHAATITVDAGVVTVADDGQCSLIEAILSANNDAAPFGSPGECLDGSGPDTITLAVATHTLTASYGYAYYSDTGLPVISTDITIDGNGATIARDGIASDFRILAVSATGSLTLNNTTISNGFSEEDGGGIYNYGGYVLLQGSTVTGNTADDDGGGLENDGGGVMIIDNSLVDDNYASGDNGGGVANEDGGDLTIRNGTTINGNDAILGGGVFQDTSAGPLRITGSTITGNYAFAGGGVGVFANADVTIGSSEISGNYAYYAGGGIATYKATVTIENGTTVTGNFAYNYGGGASFYLSTATITDSSISGNRAYRAGGGVHSRGSNLTITRSTIADNRAEGNPQQYGPSEIGGGIYAGGGIDYYYVGVSGTITVVDSTISGNVAVAGGGVYNQFTAMTLTNSTVSNNTASYAGGGLLNSDYRAVMTLNNVTVTGNTAPKGGGLFSYSGYDGDTILSKSLISGNSATNGADVYDYNFGEITADDFNVLGSGSLTNAAAFDNFTPGASDLTATSDGTNPTALASILDTTLQNNGGPTDTHALVLGSPAIDFVPSGPPTDQRGFGRPALTAFDAGAYEYEDVPPAAGFCPVDVDNVGYLRTDLLGVGQGSPKKAVRTRKLVIPNYTEVDSLYGQLAAVDVGVMKYVRFRYPNGTYEQVKDATSLAYRMSAVSWWGSELDTGYQYVKGQFFWGAKGAKSPRAFVLWPTYNTDKPYANVFTLFDESSENHVYWDTFNGWINTQTQIIEIPQTQADGATVVVKIALVDNDKDSRPVFLTVTVDGFFSQRVIYEPSDKDTLNLEEFTFTDVGAGVDEVEIELKSLPSIDDSPWGDSAAIIGAAVSYECGDTVVRAAPEKQPSARSDRPAASISAESMSKLREVFGQEQAAGTARWHQADSQGHDYTYPP